MAAVCTGVALLSFGSIVSTKLRAVVLRPHVDLSEVRASLIGIGLCGIIFAAWSFLDAF